MQSEEMPRQLLIDRSSPNAISVVGDFTFESTDTEETGVSDNDAGDKPEPSDEPFTLQGIQMAIPKGKKCRSDDARDRPIIVLIGLRRTGLHCRPGGNWQVGPPVRSSR